MKLISGLAAVALAATTLATSTLAAPPAGAASSVPNGPTAQRAVDAGARWLTGQLTDDLVHNDVYGFDDLGLSADVAFALQAVGKDAPADAVVAAIEPLAGSWAGQTPGRTYAGSLAKMVSLVQATGADPADFAGTDQVVRLESLVSSSTPIVGRLEDAGVDPSDPYDADFVNVIGQSFAARALTTAGSVRAKDATAFLLQQQCDAGFFRASLADDKTSPDQGCDPGADSGSVDTTALTIINILGTPGASTTARGAAALAADWLADQQAADGSFSAGGAEGDNANSTGLAGWALAGAGDEASAARAATWLRRVQVADLAPCATRLSADNGALAYQPGILAAARTAGITAGARDQYRRATAQALPALAHVPAAGALGIAAPATAVEGSAVTVTVSGLGAGEAACVSLGSQARSVTGTGSPLSLAFDLPAGVTTRSFTLATLAGTSTASTATTAAPVPVPAPAAPVVGELAAARVERVRRNAFRLVVRCDDATACAGTLKVRTARRLELAGGRTVKVLVAKTVYSVEAGESATLRLMVQKPARPLLGSGRLRVVAKQAVDGADTVRTPFWLKRG